MTWLWAVFFSMWVSAESLSVTDVHYTAPRGAASCGLLRHRALERDRVIRELDQLTHQTASGNERALLFANNLLTNKMFMPSEDWSDLTTEVRFTVHPNDAVASDIERRGLGHTFLLIDGPGFIWQSYMDQRPDDLKVEWSAAERALHIRYLVYANVMCGERPATPRVDWRASERP